MLKKTISMIITTIMMVTFAFATTTVNAASNLSESQAKDFFEACDINSDGKVNVCDLLIAKRTHQTSVIKAINKWLTKKPIDFAKDYPGKTGPAISLTDLRVCNDIALADVMHKISTSNETTISLENDGSVKMDCKFDTVDECYQLYTITKEETLLTKPQASGGYAINNIRVDFYQKADGIIYFVVNDATTFPIRLIQISQPTDNVTSIIRIQDDKGNVSEPIAINYGNEGTFEIEVKFDNNDEPLNLILMVANNSYKIKGIPKGYKVIKE